jgi:hypothetical protein
LTRWLSEKTWLKLAVPCSMLTGATADETNWFVPEFA